MYSNTGIAFDDADLEIFGNDFARNAVICAAGTAAKTFSFTFSKVKA